MKEWYPNARTVFVSELTAGAALSALAGVALCGDSGQPLCVDLVDILYACTNPMEKLTGDRQLGGMLPVFPSDDPIFSYAELGPDGSVRRTAEKQVISTHASAGTYFFADPGLFLKAVARDLSDRQALPKRGPMFVCPLFNGVLAEGYRVETFPVTDVRVIKAPDPA